MTYKTIMLKVITPTIFNNHPFNNNKYPALTITLTPTQPPPDWEFSMTSLKIKARKLLLSLLASATAPATTISSLQFNKSL